MNSMNFFSTIGTATPPVNVPEPTDSKNAGVKETQSSDVKHRSWNDEQEDVSKALFTQECGNPDVNGPFIDEKTPLLSERESKQSIAQRQGESTIGKRLIVAIVGSFKVVVSALLAPGQYLVACFYDEQGSFSAFLPVYRIGRLLSRRQRKTSRSEMAFSGHQSETLDSERRKENSDKPNRLPKRPSDMQSSDSEDQDDAELNDQADSPARNTRSQSTITDGDEDQASRRSIRIKVFNEDALRQRRQRPDHLVPLTAAAVKSPTSPASSLGLTKYPRPPAPPRPLVPRRQPSYSSNAPPLCGNAPSSQKTLIIDLDETLIHSMAKGGRMSTGHMVEVKLQSPISGSTVLGPQIPILYYVHKRPHCDEFLRKVSKWYNLVVFTASVQEYADPVIDWLELERKYFSKRYYRQHCTYRNGAYIKDLGHVEPNLSNAIILDNSPLSYAFHQDNAVPIEGWISDPTDNDLLHLIPLFEGLQYTTDVRSLLALRQGEPSG